MTAPGADKQLRDPEFRRRLIDNPTEALTAHGFALEDADLAEIESIRTKLGQDDAEQQLVTIAEHYGVASGLRGLVVAQSRG